MILAGFARVDVTPPLGTELAGYFEKRLARDVRDPVELNALAFGNGEDRVLLLLLQRLRGASAPRKSV